MKYIPAIRIICLVGAAISHAIGNLQLVVIFLWAYACAIEFTNTIKNFKP